MIIENLQKRVENVLVGLQSGSLVRNVVAKHADDILDLQKYQLLQGKASSGDDMRPYYTEDIQPGGYFKSVESAKKYAAWKETINYPRNAKRNSNAPNLYINGRFHSELGVQFGPTAMTIIGATTYANGIIAKYGTNQFGLTKDNWNVIFRERGGQEELLTEIKKELYK